MLVGAARPSRTADGGRQRSGGARCSYEGKSLHPNASLSLYKSTLLTKHNLAELDSNNDRQRHRSLNRYERKATRKHNRRMIIVDKQTGNLKLSRHAKQRVSSQRLIKQADSSSEGMSEWDRLEAYYRYYPVGVIAACCQRQDFLRQLESDSMKVINSFIPKRCDYKNYERLMRNARLRGKCLPREKYCANRAIILRSIGYKPQRRQTVRKKRYRSRSSSQSSEEEKEDRHLLRQTRIVEFKKKAKANSKIFIINGNYSDLRAALLDRGWLENPDSRSMLFDLKWTAKTKDIDFNSLEEEQLVNHFANNGCLTTKYGLCRSLRSMIYNQSVDVFQFYPRCYDLSDLSELENFIENYKWTYCQSLLKKYAADPSQFQTREYKIRISLAVTERRLTALHLVSDNIVQSVISQACRQYAVCSPEEWEVLTTVNPPIEAIVKLTRKSERKRKSLLDQCHRTLRSLERSDPQFYMNGGSNIWIIKPVRTLLFDSDLSRGRGIKCFTKLNDILDNTLNKSKQYVVQKYIENPLLIRNKKFDIRQWVLVRNYNPPKVWCYQECYLRFCTEQYTSEDVTNKFVHLTNNAIQKHSPEFNHTDIEGSMWTMGEFEKYLQQTFMTENASEAPIEREEQQPKIWAGIYSRIKEIIVHTVKATEDQINSRRNTFQLFGYDFMVDAQLNPWLIEVNSSPSMDHSTAITKRLVKLVLEDTVKVMLSSGKREKKDYGLFSCIYQGKKSYEF